ncbi:MAG TPA: proton-conducting transporter membrane subunit [Verrucomicrobiae bacterium]|nr:proton-conducting transporter membrane subunit [Verrucomicrobiae bacterium]
MSLIVLLCVPLVAGLLSLVVRHVRALEAINLLAFGTVTFLAVRLVGAVLVAPGGVVLGWGEFLRADALSAWMALVVGVVSLGSSFYAVGYFRRELVEGQLTVGRCREFYRLTHFFATAMLLVVLVNNLGVMWVAVEGTALSSVLLVALYNRKTSLEAAWKYIMLGGVGLVLALFGTVLTYAAALGHAGGEALPSFDWSSMRGMASQLDPKLMRLAFIFLFVGYGTKAGLAPMHSWLPDAHSEAPSPTSAMLSGVSLKVAVYALLRGHMLATACLHSDFSRHLLLGFGLLSMIIAGPFVLTQKNLKRMLAYSSLEHVGLVCVGFGLNTPLTVFGALLHMGYHALAKPVLFFAAGNIHQRYHALDFRRLGGGLGRTMPMTALLLAVAAVAISGLPPFGLFYSELTIFAGAFVSHQAWAGAVALLALLVVFCGMLKRFAHLLLGRPGAEISRESWATGNVLAMVLPLVVLLVLSIWLPAPARQLLERAAGIIGGAP